MISKTRVRGIILARRSRLEEVCMHEYLNFCSGTVHTHAYKRKVYPVSLLCLLFLFPRKFVIIQYGYQTCLHQNMLSELVYIYSTMTTMSHNLYITEHTPSYKNCFLLSLSHALVFIVRLSTIAETQASLLDPMNLHAWVIYDLINRTKIGYLES